MVAAAVLEAREKPSTYKSRRPGRQVPTIVDQVVSFTFATDDVMVLDDVGPVAIEDQDISVQDNVPTFFWEFLANPISLVLSVAVILLLLKKPDPALAEAAQGGRSGGLTARGRAPSCHARSRPGSGVPPSACVSCAPAGDRARVIGQDGGSRECYGAMPLRARCRRAAACAVEAGLRSGACSSS
jgi:hypothetical protein